MAQFTFGEGRPRGRTLLWCIGVGGYLLFLWWYTNTGGPLSNAEIAEFVERMRQSGEPSERIARLRRFMSEDDGGQFLMVNLVDMADTPKAVPGVPTGETSEAMLARYMAHMTPELLKRAGHPVFAGEAIFRAMDLTGIDGAERWTDFALMRYRSRRDLLEIALNPVFADKHVFKIAALQKTIAFPVAPGLYLSDPRLLLLLVLFPVLLLGHALLPGRTQRFL